ncbi:PREDICTED: LOW QUALITY PROTEIN [Prunus dulcis]|uniref:PREDICTED: LOW QUALITY PROTEIN n=1 Tax=Prunus dulcis TaxID=3755 RepID=A0A5E4FS97_PRUDU|nr:uncharacterized protein LOC117635311 [Prunus dulcis]VVA30368.1 PREDICTED: LOW QUALITY PROTEIN [Prunus dulcis]
MKKPVQVYISSVLKACRNHVNVSNTCSPPQLNIKNLRARAATPTAPTTLVGPPDLTRLTNKVFPSYGNPCLDLFYQVVPDAANAAADSHKYLKQLLPVAWAHNPSTTLKLICNKLNVHGKDDEDGFYTAAFWLHHNHPKTLARNVLSIAGSFGTLNTLLGILYRILQGQDRPVHLCLYGDIITVSSAGSETILALARMAVERYQRDPDYRFLHDRISDLFADCLKSDIQNLNKHHQQNINDDEDDESTKCLETTYAADWCPSIDSSFDHATLLCESIAKKFFPRESYLEYEGVEEADYAYRVRHRLRKEVLVPLRKVLECSNYHTGMNKWGYNSGFKREPCVVKKYLEDVKAAGNSKIEPGALLPHEIIDYVNDGDVGQVAEIQWKAMVEHIYLKQGRFKNCLPVCHNFGERLAALQILMSELSEEPWNGKLINFSENPQLYSLQGLDDLKSKGELVKRMDQDWGVDMHKVFDLILEVALKGHLKPEQMIRRVFVFASGKGFDDALGYDRCWKTDYEAIQRKFKDNGYGDVVPQIVFWNVSNVDPTSVRSIEQGVAMLSGFNTNLIKSFLDNDGEIGPDHVMEAAISDPEYQNLVVVD